MKTTMKTRIVLALAGVVILLSGLAVSAIVSSTHGQGNQSIALASSSTPVPKNDIQKDDEGSSTVANPDILTQYGPIGTLITLLGSGVVMVIRSINEGKKIDVERFKERATEAESRADTEIGKVYKKLEEMEKKLDDVIEDRERERTSFEAQKIEFNDQILGMETRHRAELESVHRALLVEVYARHKIEEILASRGIVVPSMEAPCEEDLIKVQSEAEDLIRDVNN